MADLNIISSIQPTDNDCDGANLAYPVANNVLLVAGTTACFNSAGKTVNASANTAGLQQAKGILLERAGSRQGSTCFVRGRLSGFDLSSYAYDTILWLSDNAGNIADTPSNTKPIAIGRVVPLSDSPNMSKALYVDFSRGWTEGFGRNAIYSVTVGGGATGGTFTLVYGGQTATITYAATLTAASVMASLQALSSIGANNVLVTGANGGPYLITFQNALGLQAITMTTGGAGSLTGGTPTLALTPQISGY